MRPTKNGKSRMESQIPDKLLPARIAKWTESRWYKRHTLNDGTSSRAKSRNRTSATANYSLTTYTHTFLELFEFAFGDADRAHKFWSPQLAHTFSGLIEPSSGVRSWCTSLPSLFELIELNFGVQLWCNVEAQIWITPEAHRAQFWSSPSSLLGELTQRIFGEHRAKSWSSLHSPRSFSPSLFRVTRHPKLSIQNTVLELFEFTFGVADRAHKFWSSQHAHTFSGPIEPSSGVRFWCTFLPSLFWVSRHPELLIHNTVLELLEFIFGGTNRAHKFRSSQHVPPTLSPSSSWNSRHPKLSIHIYNTHSRHGWQKNSKNIIIIFSRSTWNPTTAHY